MDSRLESNFQTTLERFYMTVGNEREKFKANWKQFELSLQSQTKSLLNTNKHNNLNKSQAEKPQRLDELTPQFISFTNQPPAAVWPNDFTFRQQNSQLYKSPERRIIKNKFKSDSLQKTILFALVFNHYFLCKQKKSIQQINTEAARIFQAIRQSMTKSVIQFNKGTSFERLKQLQIIRSLVGRQGECIVDKNVEQINVKVQSLDNDYVTAVFKSLGDEKKSSIVDTQSRFGYDYLSQMPSRPTTDIQKAAKFLGIRIRVYEDKIRHAYGRKSALCCININKSTRKLKYILKDIICYSQQDRSDDTNESPQGTLFSLTSETSQFDLNKYSK